MNDEQDLESGSSPKAPPPGRLSEHLLEAGLRAVFAAGAHEIRPPPEALEPELPSRIGRYDILDVIGRGGVGVVLKARDAELRRDIAIKLLLDSHRGNPGMMQRFIEESQVAGQLEHPGIVAVHEAGLFGGDRPYFSMKLVKGRTLAGLLQERDSPGADRVRFLGIFEQVAQTVAYAHSRGVIHRDLKPSNIMVGAFGEVQVMDWGLAKVIARGPAAASPAPASQAPVELFDAVDTLRAEAADSRSLAGAVMGTPAYMSPEQARGEVETLDPRTDVFGLGAILCEILTGKPPFHGKTTQEIFRMARGGEVEDAVRRVDGCGADPEILPLARACLAPDRTERPPDAGAVADAIKAYRESLEARARRSALEAAEARVKADGERRARRLTIGLAAVVCVSLLLGGGGYLWVQAERSDRIRAAQETVNAAMGEARQLRGQAGLGAAEDSVVDLARMEAAVAAARRGQERARGGAVEPSLERQAEELRAQMETDLERVRQARARADKNLRMTEELERIRAAYMDDRDPRKPDAMYAKSFQELAGTDIETLDPEEAAAALRETGIAEELAGALDDWARVRREIRSEGAPPWKGLVRLAELTDPDPWRVKLRDAIRTEDKDALQVLKDPAALEGASARDLGLLAMGLKSHGDLAAALSVLELARERYPGDFWILFNLGVNSSFANLAGVHRPPRREEPIRYLTAARALRPHNAYVDGLLSTVLREKGEFSAALEAARKGVSLRPEDPLLLNSLGLALEASGDVEGALETFRKALAIDPRMSLVHANMGATLCDRRELDAALTSLERAVELSPEDGRMLSALGDVLFKLGRREEAIERFKLAVEQLPEFITPRNNLGYAYLTSDRFEEAAAALKVAVQKDPSHAFARNNLGAALLGLGRRIEAIPEFLEAIRLDPANSFPYRHLLEIIDNDGALDAEKPLEELILALDRLISSKEPRHNLAARTFVAAWCRRPETLDHAGPLKVADLEVQRTDRQDPAALKLLGRVLSIARRNREAVLALEEARGSPGDPSWVATTLASARAALLPDLVSYASIDAAVELLDDSVTLEMARESFAAFRAAARGDDGAARRHYLEARLLDRSGMHVEAAEQFRGVLSLDRSFPEPYIRLWESLRAAGDPERARHTYRDDLTRLGLPSWTLPVPADRPRNLEPAAGAIVDGEAAELRVTPFEHIDPRMERLATRWQVRSVHADYSRNPTLDIVTGAGQDTLRVPQGLLLPSSEYTWRAFQVDSDGKPSEYSEETSFRTLAGSLEAVPLDLSAIFNRDVVADPGDQENNSFDADEGSLLVVEGFNGEREGVPEVRGVPGDGIVGVHRLGEPRGLNAVQLAPSDKDPVRISIPRGRYACIRFLVSGGNGNSTVSVTFEFVGGGTERHELPCDDWYRDLPPARHGRIRPGSIPVWNGMDRLSRGRFQPVHEPALFEVLLPIPGDRELEAISLDPAGASFDGPRTRFHLFAVTGIRRK